MSEQLKRLMTRTAHPWDRAMIHAEAGISVGAELVTLCPIDGKDEDRWKHGLAQRRTR